MNGYDLSRQWFNWCFENPEKIKPNHTALYFFIIEHCNRMGWVEKFGLPTEMAKTAIGISNYRTYTNTINDLADWGFIKFIQRSQNQYSSNIIAIVKNAISHTKALDKATHKHGTKQSISIAISTDSINKHITNNKEQRTENQNSAPHPILENNSHIPTIEQVTEQFKLKGGTEGMAEKFHNKHLATGYMAGHTRLINWSTMVYGFITHWKENENKPYNQIQKSSHQKLEI